MVARRAEDTEMAVVLCIMCWLFFAIWCALLANSKGRSPVGWFALGFLFGPFALLFAFYAGEPAPSAPVALNTGEAYRAVFTAICYLAIGLTVMLILGQHI
jgi:hypothetical protein